MSIGRLRHNFIKDTAIWRQSLDAAQHAIENFLCKLVLLLCDVDELGQYQVGHSMGIFLFKLMILELH